MWVPSFADCGEGLLSISIRRELNISKHATAIASWTFEGGKATRLGPPSS